MELYVYYCLHSFLEFAKNVDLIPIFTVLKQASSEQTYMTVTYFLSSSQYLHGPSVASDNVLLKYHYIVTDITENN
jgi:hypothetical protein